MHSSRKRKQKTAIALTILIPSKVHQSLNKGKSVSSRSSFVMSSLSSEIKRKGVKESQTKNSYLVFPEDEETKENSKMNQEYSQRINKIYPKPKPILTNKLNQEVNNRKKILKLTFYI